MNFKQLAQYPVTTRVEIGEGFEIKVDANKYNGECFRRMARTYKERAKEFDAGRAEVTADVPEVADNLSAVVARYEGQMELTAITADLEREQYADVLAIDRHGILMDWEQEEDGRSVPPTFENLMQVPGAALKAIFDAGREAANPKQQGTPTTQTTLETSSDGSSDQITHSSAAPIG
jgi:hypothetical protein